MSNVKEKVKHTAEYYENISNNILVGTGNTKTGLDCLTLSVPTSECREDAPCKKGCYCLKGRQTMPQVLGGYMRNNRIWKENHTDFQKQLFNILNKTKRSKFRWFDAGDIPDADFLDMMFRTARKYKKITFLCYTKKFELVNEYLNHHRLPSNLCIRLSTWDKLFIIENPHNLPTTYVDFKDSNRNIDIPKNSFKCPGSGSGVTCSTCGVCFNKKVQHIVFKQH